MRDLSTNYAILRAKLIEVTAAAPWPSPEAGFLDYLQSIACRQVPDRALVTDRLSETPMLASAGYQYANPNFSRSASYDQEWSQQFRRLEARQAFPSDRESYFYRPLDLLGICLGARHCPGINEDDRRWLQQVLKEGATRLNEHSRSHYLGAVAAAQVGVTWTMRSTPRVQDLSISSLSLLHWITNQDGIANRIGLTVDDKEVASIILRQAFTAEIMFDDLADAGLVLQATEAIIDRTIKSRIEYTWDAPRNRDAAQTLVRTICERFLIVANTLKDRHSGRETITINDEYDVQDLLEALLKLHFSDVRPEEWTPSYAGNASRMDFLLKPEQLVIEAKMTRKGLGQKEVVSQLAVDILRYQAHQDCKTLICFVYDPTGTCASPQAIENDLTKIHGKLDVIVIVQPKNR